MGTYIATLLVGTVLSVPNGQFPVIPTSGSVYASNTAVTATPITAHCHLQSYMDNGVVRTIQVCQ